MTIQKPHTKPEAEAGNRKKTPQVPPREDRLGSIIVAGGTAKELVTQTKKRCLKNQDRSFTQATFCQ